MFYLFIHIDLVQIVIDTSIIMSSSINNPGKWSNLTPILKLYLVRHEVLPRGKALVHLWFAHSAQYIGTKKAKHGGAQALLFILQHVAISVCKSLGPNWTERSVFQPWQRVFFFKLCSVLQQRRTSFLIGEKCTVFKRKSELWLFGFPNMTAHCFLVMVVHAILAQM